MKQCPQVLVIGSGAAGLAAAIRLHALGIRPVIITEGIHQGTSINAGSDKQTYYKLGLTGAESDSPALMAASFTAGGSADGRLALIESALSTRAFFQLVELGVAFPKNDCGEYVGYKTDHDPRSRATSAGPYTSRDMCRALLAEVRRRKIRILSPWLVTRLITAAQPKDRPRRVVGLVMIHRETARRRVLRADAIVFAVGGPGGLYRASVYPESQFGAIGMALAEGAEAVSLPESQFGLASVTPWRGGEFRWNVSGTYMQVLPRVVSTAEDGNDEREFLREFLPNRELFQRLFLKGYQWPFDAAKLSGSSLIDMLVFHENICRRRRVFLDYRSNPSGLNLLSLDREPREYLSRSGALFGTPFERLAAMNPKAIALYRDHGIDLANQMLEIRLCAQHNNGGLAVDPSWESTTVEGLFPIGEVAGTHGVTRPGGSALNAGQVGAIRAAEAIAQRVFVRHKEDTRLCRNALRNVSPGGKTTPEDVPDWRDQRREFQERMTRFAGHLRSKAGCAEALSSARAQYETLSAAPLPAEPAALRESLRNRQLLFAQIIYLEAILAQISSGTGSRASSLVLSPDGELIHPALPNYWRVAGEDKQFRSLQLFTRFDPETGTCGNVWREAPPIPEPDRWFESVWGKQPQYN